MSQIKNLLTDNVKEENISNIIIDYKNEMEFIHNQRLYKKWVREERKLSKELIDAKANVKELKKKIKKMCKHTNITEKIYPGWERSEYSYRCNICNFHVQIHEEFDYRNITKTIE